MNDQKHANTRVGSNNIISNKNEQSIEYSLSKQLVEWFLLIGLSPSPGRCPGILALLDTGLPCGTLRGSLVTVGEAELGGVGGQLFSSSKLFRRNCFRSFCGRGTV